VANEVARPARPLTPQNVYPLDPSVGMIQMAYAGEQPGAYSMQRKRLLRDRWFLRWLPA